MQSPVRACIVYLGLHQGGPGVNRPALTHTFEVLSVCYDVLIFFLPVHSLMKLNIPWQPKHGVCSVFLVGFIVTICGIVRLQYRVRFNPKENPAGSFSQLLMWSIIEIYLSMVCIYLESRNDKRVDTEINLANGEHALVRGEADGGVREDAEGGLVYDLCSKSFKDEQPFGAASALEQHDLSQYTTSAPLLGKQIDALIHQARPAGQQNKNEISHNPPTATSETAFSYHDDNDIVHQVTLTDIPEGEYALPGSKLPPPSKQLSDLRVLKVNKKIQASKR